MGCRSGLRLPSSKVVLQSGSQVKPVAGVGCTGRDGDWGGRRQCLPQPRSWGGGAERQAGLAGCRLPGLTSAPASSVYLKPLTSQPKDTCGFPDSLNWFVWGRFCAHSCRGCKTVSTTTLLFRGCPSLGRPIRAHFAFAQGWDRGTQACKSVSLEPEDEHVSRALPSAAPRRAGIGSLPLWQSSVAPRIPARPSVPLLPFVRGDMME